MTEGIAENETLVTFVGVEAALRLRLSLQQLLTHNIPSQLIVLARCIRRED
jgi:hypothetical protein